MARFPLVGGTTGDAFPWQPTVTTWPPLTSPRPEPVRGVRGPETEMLPMRDGVRIATDIYFPDASSGRAPAIVHRTFTSRRDPIFVSQSQFLARAGYVVLMQESRGRHESEGEHYHARGEDQDGVDTLAWVLRQAWSNGKVATYGMSFSSQVQTALAVASPPGLVAMNPMEGPFDLYEYGWRQDGTAQLKTLFATHQLALTSPRVMGDPDLRARLMSEPVIEFARRGVARQGETLLAATPDYERYALDCLTLGDRIAYWDDPAFSTKRHMATHADVPTLIIGGWFDSWSRASVEYFTELAARITGPVRLLMGPWAHGDEETVARSYSGEVDFGPSASLDTSFGDLMSVRLRWFDHWVKGDDAELWPEVPVTYFVMGGGTGRRNGAGRIDHGGQWRTAEGWPVPGTSAHTLYLRAAGKLATSGPAGGDPASTAFDSDPDDPYPTASSNVSGLYEVRYEPETGFTSTSFVRQGPFDHERLIPRGSRGDVVTFESDPLDRALVVVGSPVLHLWVASSTPDADIAAKVLDVYPPSKDDPEGFAMFLCDGIVRGRYRHRDGRSSLLTPGQIEEIEVVLDPTSNSFAPGHRIRVQVSGASFPKFDVNPNTGDPLWSSPSRRVSTLTIYHAGSRSSTLILPTIA